VAVREVRFKKYLKDAVDTTFMVTYSINLQTFNKESDLFIKSIVLTDPFHFYIFVLVYTCMFSKIFFFFYFIKDTF